MRALRLSSLLLILATGLLSAQTTPFVQLVVPSNTLAPTSTLELRFAEPMVEASQKGQVADPSPLVISPALKGKFTWLTESSGVFVPSEAPPMATTFRLQMRSGLKALSGRSAPADWSAVVNTPPMQMLGARQHRWLDASDAPPEPALSLLFNVAVSAERLAKHCRFVDSLGQQVPASVTQAADGYHYQHLYHGYGNKLVDLLPWRDRFAWATKGGDEPLPAPENQLVISPAQPLPPGTKWELVIDAGAPAEEESLRLLQPIKIGIGNVKPFQVLRAEARNYIHSGKHLVIEFSKPVSKEVTSHTAGRWISVSPEPAGLKAEPQGTTVVLKGDWKLGEKYRVTVDAGMPASDPRVTAVPFAQDLFFEQVPPRLYFESFDTHQMSTGRRNFILLSVNVPKVRMKAKLFAPEVTSAALQAWRKYFRGYDENASYDYLEPYRRVEVEGLAGQDVFDRVYDIERGVDEKGTLYLNWDDVLGAGQTGLVLLTAEAVDPVGTGGKRPGTQAIVQVTDLGLVWKTSRRETFVYAFSLATGRPVPEAGIQLLDGDGNSVAEGKSDTSGILRVPSKPEARWLFARSGEDSHLTHFALGQSTISLGRYAVDFEANGGEYDDSFDGGFSPERRVLVFTDRGVYKPGETVHVKGIVREYGTGKSVIPAGANITIVMEDPRGRDVFENEVTITEFGSFDTDIVLKSNNLGWYPIYARMLSPGANGEEVLTDEATHGVQVQEYVPDAFEIIVDGGRNLILPAAVEFAVKAKYYMGKPLSKARLKWTLRAEDSGFSPAGFGDFVFCDGVQNYRLSRALNRMNIFAEQGEADLDSSGVAVVRNSIPPNPKAPQPRTARLLSEITDMIQQTVANEHSVTLHSSDFYLGLGRMPNVVREGEKLPLSVVAVRADGTPEQAPIEAQLRLTRVDWQTNRIIGAGGAEEYRSEPRFTLVAQTRVRTQKVEMRGRKWAVASGDKFSTDVFAGAPGQYLLELSARDAGGNEVNTSVSFYVWGKAATIWNYRNPFQIELVPDKESYRVGEKARLLVKTPISGDALVTIERENVSRSFVTRLEGNAPAIEVNLEDADAPNVFVSVMLLRGAEASPKKHKAPEYRVGYLELPVERSESRLTVYVKPDAPAHRPGEPVDVSVEVIGFDGKGVPGAEVTLYACDEGVLALTGYETPNPLEFFGRKRPLAVSTGLTLPRMLDENPDEADFGNKGFLIGGKGGPDRVRKNFQACAFWAASLQTDAEGRLTARFNAPDGLTRYRVIVVAQSKRDQFGSAQSAFEINKPFMLEPALPRFANVGDELLLRAVLHNTTELPGDAEMRISKDSMATIHDPVRRVEIPAKGSVTIDMPARFEQIGEAVWTWSAVFTPRQPGGEVLRDSVQTKLKVHYPTPARTAVELVRLTGKEGELLSTLDPLLRDGHATVTLSLANSRVLELNEAVRSLLHYPYGCVEQTTSSTLPWLTLKGLRNELPELRKTDEEIAAMVERGVNRLLAMQTDSGGLSYWPGVKEPMYWGSAYGGLGLALARKAGYPVPEEEFDRLCSYLSEGLRGIGKEPLYQHLGEKCLALYALALAGRSEPAYHELLFQRRASLHPESRALLAMALVESGGSEQMVTDLLREIPITGSDARDFQHFYSPSREAAMRLIAWMRVNPEAPQVEQSIARLFGGRSAGAWLTTQGNAWALLAISEYVSHFETRRGPVTGTVTGVGNEAAFSLTNENPSAEFTWPLSAATEALKVSKPGDAPLFAAVRVSSRPREIMQPRQDHGFSIARRYERVTDEGKIEPLQDARVGDRVLVTLDLQLNKGAEYVAIEDPLPALLEAVHPEFKTSQAVGQELATNWASDFHELREDRAMFFCNDLAPGRYTIRYLARIRAAGSATAPSARVEEMYHPTRFGMSETGRMTALPLH